MRLLVACACVLAAAVVLVFVALAPGPESKPTTDPGPAAAVRGPRPAGRAQRPEAAVAPSLPAPLRAAPGEVDRDLTAVDATTRPQWREDNSERPTRAAPAARSRERAAADGGGATTAAPSAEDPDGDPEAAAPPDDDDGAVLHVVDSLGVAVEDAWIAIGNPRTLEYLHFRSDAAGRIPLPDTWPRGADDLQAMQNGYARVRMRIHPRDLPGTAIVLTTVPHASARVTFADGTPVPGARVSVRPAAESWHALAVTDDTGRFTVPRLPPGDVEVTVRVGEHAWEFGAPFDLTAARWRLRLVGGPQSTDAAAR